MRIESHYTLQLNKTYPKWYGLGRMYVLSKFSNDVLHMDRNLFGYVM